MAESFEMPTAAEAIAATTIPPNPDQPPATSEGDIDTGVTYDGEGHPQNTAGLELTSDEKAALNLTAETDFTGEPGETYDPMLDVSKRVRNISYEAFVSGPGGPSSSVPIVVDAPLVTQNVGELECTLGSWTGEPTSRSYQWTRDGLDAGTDSPTYTIVDPDDVGTTFSCTMIASNALGASEPVTSNEVVVNAP